MPLNKAFWKTFCLKMQFWPNATALVCPKGHFRFWVHEPLAGISSIANMTEKFLVEPKAFEQVKWGSDYRCVLIFVIVIILVVLYLYYLIVAQIVLLWCFILWIILVLSKNTFFQNFNSCVTRQWMDRWTDRLTDGLMDNAFYRDARMHLKSHFVQFPGPI